VVRCMQGVVTAVSVVLQDCSLKLHACHHAIMLMISDGGGAGEGLNTITCLYDVMQSHSIILLLFFRGRRMLCAFNAF